MGPQSCDCGKQTHPTAVSGCVALQWGRSLATAESKPIRQTLVGVLRFNGAAVLRLRKSQLSGTVALKEGLLQWGRSLATAESTPTCHIPLNRASFNGAAVLRLRKARRQGIGLRKRLRFNGAAVLRLRKAEAARGF